MVDTIDQPCPCRQTNVACWSPSPCIIHHCCLYLAAAYWGFHISSEVLHLQSRASGDIAVVYVSSQRTSHKLKLGHVYLAIDVWAVKHSITVNRVVAGCCGWLWNRFDIVWDRYAVLVGGYWSCSYLDLTWYELWLRYCDAERDDLRILKWSVILSNSLDVAECVRNLKLWK